MGTTVQENAALNKCAKRIEYMEKELQDMRVYLERDLIIYKLEDLCTMFKGAIIHYNLNYPPLTIFERYIHKIKNRDDVLYVVELLHQCWLYIHPENLINRPLKQSISQYDMLDIALSNYDENNLHPLYDLDKDTDRDNINELIISFTTNLPQKYKAAYGKYVDGLLSICRSVCQHFEIELDDNFTIRYILKSKLQLTTAQIDKVFKAVADEGMMNNDPDTAASFRALFESSVIAPEHKIVWLDTTKGHSPNYASLYTMFNTMGVEMDRYNRSVICKTFTTKDGNIIKEEQIKTRKSDRQIKLEKIIEETLKMS